MGRMLELFINGAKVAVESDPDRSLLSVLRNDLDLTGTKYGCGEGRCGACTVLMDGNPVRSCKTEVGRVEGKQITTIEGIEQNGTLHPLQISFLKFGAMQCAYCTSGMILSGVALLRKTPQPSDVDIMKFMEGNICRCGTYPRILEAIREAARVMAGNAK